MTDYYPKPQPILVVDDNEDDYEAVARAFQKVGMTRPLSLCTSGQGAIDFLKKENSPGQPDRSGRPTLIMLDLNMPGMDGFQVLQRIRQDTVLHRIPVVIWTTSSNEKDVDMCYQMGANAFMQKPVAFGDLVQSIKHLKEYWLETVLLPV